MRNTPEELSFILLCLGVNNQTLILLIRKVGSHLPEKLGEKPGLYKCPVRMTKDDSRKVPRGIS